MKHFTWMMLAVALAFGCDETSEEPAEETVVEAEGDDEAPEAAEAEEEEDVLPTPEDFEEEASEAITAENLEDEVAKLEETLDEEQGD
jgi:hypothetical protein